MSSRRGFWTEMLAFYILESLGFEIEAYRHRVEREGVEVAEIDALAEKNGEKYAVEVKSGRISTTDVRQAYTNAKLLGAKPLVVARGFADKSAEVYARELGVEVLVLPDYFHFISTEELVATLEDAILNVFERLIGGNFEDLSHEELETLRAIAFSKSAEEAYKRLGKSFEEFSRTIGGLREKGVITEDGSFNRLKMQARLFLLLRKLLVEQ